MPYAATNDTVLDVSLPCAHGVSSSVATQGLKLLHSLVTPTTVSKSVVLLQVDSVMV